LSSANANEKQLLQTVKSFDELFLVVKQFATVTSLRLENPALSDAFIISNVEYICSIIGIELNQAQRVDLIDEIGQVGWLTMADFKLFLDRMKKYKFYRRDYQELLQAFWQYCDERLDRAFEIETAKTDNTDYAPRTGEMRHLKDIEIMKINAERKQYDQNE